MANEIVSKKKAILAKLLAQENLTIEFQNVSTASFNIQTRVLTLPNMRDDLSPELYNLFIGHEVGHALWTPMDYQNDSIVIPDSLKSGDKDHDKMIEQNLKNIVEDIRIERKIKQKYPGIKRDFIFGYKELLEKDFFKTNGKDVNSLGFLNRLNLYAKCGLDSNVQFSPEEQILVNKCESAQSYEDMIGACQSIIDYVAAKHDDPNGGHSDISTGFRKPDKKNEDPIDQHTQFGTIAPPEDKLYKKLKSNPKEFDPNEKAKGSNVQVTYDDDDVASGSVEEDLDTSTNSELNEALKELFDLFGSKNIITYNLPKFNLKNIIVDNATFNKAMEKSLREIDGKLSDFAISEPYREYRDKNMPMIRFMVKEFELKKHAKELQREQPYKTGKLDTKRVCKYQVTNDIFKTGVYHQTGKSHGLQLFIDWSGSMDYYLRDSLCQLFCLTDFCRAIGIPFDVYSFRSGMKRGMTGNFGQPQIFQTVGPSYLDLHNFHLVHMLSSQQNHVSYIKTQKHLIYLVANNHRDSGNYLSTDSTPLNNAIVAAIQIIPEFQQKYKLEIVNSIFITDGGSDTTTVYFNPHNTATRDYGTPSNVAYIVDPISKQYEKLQPEDTNKNGGNFMTTELLQLLQRITDTNSIGFFLTGMDWSSLKETYGHPDNKQTKELWYDNGYSIQYGVGYKVHYTINTKNIHIKDLSLHRHMIRENKDSKQMDNVVDAWNQTTAKVMKNRAMLTNFIQQIS